MKGVCFQQVRQVNVQELADPMIEQPGDAIVRVRLAGLCGSDLHPYFGREQGLEPGTVMGHEFVGEVVTVGEEVALIRPGDRVCAPFTTNCGDCYFCQRGLTSRCVTGQLFGWREAGAGLHGGQATMVRVPLADATLMKVPSGITDELALLIGDNLSTGYFAADLVAVEAAGVYVVIGCGTVGLLAITSALRRGAKTVFAVDPNESRTEIANSLGAHAVTDAGQALSLIRDCTSGHGADGVMEVVGLPPAQQLAYQLLRPGGTMSVIGCHCTPGFAFSPADAYNKNLTYRTGRCPARYYMPHIAADLERDPVDLSWCVTHRFAIDQARQAYDVFASGQHGCIKAVLTF